MTEYASAIDISIGNKIQINFSIEKENWDSYFKQIKETSINLSKYIFTLLHLNDYATTIEYSIILMDDKNIATLNNKFRGKNKATNVLSFPLEEIEANKFEQLQIHDEFLVLGDIIFAYETIKKESEEQNISFIDHFTHLLTHGILHCLGYDHEEENEAQIMENLETKILSHFNIKSPYNYIN